MSEKKSPMKMLHKIIILALAVIIVVSGIGMVREYMEARRADEEYKRLAELAKQTTEAPPETEAETEIQETEAPFVSPIDFEALSAINPDIVGWIRIPDTNVDYPIVQAPDNDKYLHTSFEGENSKAGAIFLDFESDSDLYGLNNVIYGHNMKNGSMFKDVVKYKDKEFFESHPTVWIYTPERTIQLKVLSAYYDEAKAIARKTKFKDQASFDAFVNAMLQPCSFAEIPQQPIPRLYSLITCSYEINDARTFLFAAEVDEEGNIVANTAAEEGE